MVNKRGECLKVSFEKILEEYSGVLSRVASTYEANISIQQELFQEICVAVWQAMGRFQNNSSVKTYILKIAHNRAVSHVAKEVTVVSNQSDELNTNDVSSSVRNCIEQNVIQSQQIQSLLEHIRALPMPARQIISLSLEGLSYEEIAEITGLTTNHVGVSINRIKKQLREAISNE